MPKQTKRKKEIKEKGKKETNEKAWRGFHIFQVHFGFVMLFYKSNPNYPYSANSSECL